MKNFFLKLSTLLILLAMSVNVLLGQDATTIYLASLKAQSSEISTGSGQVKLTWLDIKGRPMTVQFAKQINKLAFSDDSFMTKESVYDGFADEVQLAGGTLLALDGMETDVEIESGSQIFMTSFLYFHAEAQPVDGSYLSEWQIISDDNLSVTRMTSSMNPADPMGDGGNIPFRTPCFKVVPNKENSTSYPPKDGGKSLTELLQSVAAAPNTIYAVFNKYLLSNPVAFSAIMEADQEYPAELEVIVEINGDASSLDADDFAEFTFTNNDNDAWAYDLGAALDPDNIEIVSEQKTRIYIPVTYTYHNDGYGVKNTTMTIRMAGENPSELNVNLSVEVLDPDRPEAFWFDGKVEKTSGYLADMLDMDISMYANPILKLNQPVDGEEGLTFSGKTFTLDLNGNYVSSVTVESGEITIAYSKLIGVIDNLIVSGGKTVLNGGEINGLTIGASGAVEQNGATIFNVVNNAGTLVVNDGRFEDSGLISSGALTVNGGTFTGNPAITVEGGTAVINRGTVGFIYDEESELTEETTGLLVTSGEVTIKKLAAIMGTHAVINDDENGAGTVNIECGKFEGAIEGEVNLTSGYFKNADDTVGLSAGKDRMLVSAGVEYNEGYRYFLGSKESALANGVGVCRIGNVSYAKLEDAIAYANNNPGVANIVIFMTNDYVLPAGYYTLPANATIVVPMSDEQAKEVNKIAPRVVFNDQKKETPYVSIQPTEFRRLTFASGVNMDVFGQIELTCSQYASNEAYTSQPVGYYGHVVLEEGSHLTLQSGSEVRAWGFITGKGEMDARRGATVREMFQMGDWKGAMTSVKITGMVPSTSPAYSIVGGDDSDKKIFPVTQYFIQNIESPVKYHPGALLLTSAAVSEGLLGLSVSMAATDIAVVGVSGTHQAIFLMDQMADAENTWVRKWYDSENDIQVYDINSGAHIGSMVLDMGDINLLTYGAVPIRLNSAKFDLPITSNFKIHLLSGTMDFQQNTCLLPGAEVEVDKEAMVTVAKNMNDPEHTGALYVFDATEWDKYAYCNEYDGSSFVKGKAYTKVVRYAPSWNGRPSKRAEQTKPADATINVHGTFATATGFVYTSESGANIFSNNTDAGTFIFNENAVDAGTRTVYQVEGVGTYKSRMFYPARLKNGVADPAFANTSTAQEGDAYCYQDDKWNIFKVAQENRCFMVDDYDTYYAKPQEYVALANGMTPNDDHTYSDAAGQGRLFILMDDCQWWEVEKKDNLHHCIHPNNDTYYYWHEEETVKPDPEAEDTWVTIPGYWEEKRFTITWKNWDGTEIISYDYTDPNNPFEISYDVTYGTMAEFFGTNPTREKDADSTYNFTGWKPALGPVTQDVTYTATFKGEQRMYTIIFQNEGGLEIERQFLAHNEVPVCENMPTKVGHILQWSPAIGKVVADATYVANWLEEPPTKYEIRFVDYDGTVLWSDSVEVGSMPTPPSYPSNKPATKENTYTCSSWDAEVVAVTDAATYTAVYTPTPKIFTVIFRNEDNSEIERHDYMYGETPVCSATPSKPNTAEWTYKLAWTPQIQSIVGDLNPETPIIYTADFESLKQKNRYTVTLRSNIPDACVFTSGAGTYDYGTDITISKADNPGYEFVNWTDGETGAEVTNLSIIVTKNISLVANFTIENPAYTIRWMSEDGTETLQEVHQNAGTTTYTAVPPTKPTDEEYSYIFDGWTTSPNGEGTFYLNGKTPKATEDATYYAHFAATQKVEPEIESIELDVNGSLDLGDAPTTKQDLVLTSNGIDASGQLLGAANLNLMGEAIFRLEKSLEAQVWYTVAVPWAVALDGIRDNNGYAFAANNVNVLEFDAAAYACASRDDDRSSYWHFLNQSGNDMQPGKLYMIWFREAQAAVEFHKKAGEPIWTTSTSVTLASGSNVDQSNWNAIANPALYYADLSTETEDGDVLKYNGNDSYVLGYAYNMIVGEPMFVQVAEGASVVANIAGSTPAPFRRALQENTADNRFVIELNGNGKLNDRMIVQTAEEKADTYVIGKDLAKMGVSALNAQMWIDRYDAKLCKNTVALQGEQVEYPLNISAPAVGEYILSALQERGDATLYLTHNGEAIWDLSEGDYVLNLEQGTTADYGLRISTRKTPTGIDEAVVEANGDIRKVLVNDKVFIIRGNNVYTIDGQLVK